MSWQTMRIIGILFGIAFLVGVALAGSLYWDAFVISPNESSQELMFQINEGDGVEKIARELKAKELISSVFLFKVYVKLAGEAENLQAGEFKLKQGMSYHQIVLMLKDAKAKEVQITIPEGYTLAQVQKTVTDKLKFVDDKEWARVTGQQGKLELAGADILSGIPSGQGLEGYLFPDTYRLREESNAKTVVETMVMTLKRRLAENNVVIPEDLVMQNNMTFHEVLTLASIIEREVRDFEDMKIVSGIFQMRIKIGMALQADSTVNYITGKTSPSITFEDSKLNSPYNTYKQLGLPPGPISNPGTNAILAALNPEKSDYLYFLTAKDGTVIYAKTFDEHIANKYKFLK